MHPSKAEALKKLAEVSRELDSEIEKIKDVALNPGRHGWSNSLNAIVTVSALGAGALVVDASEVVVRSISDRRWERQDPGTDAVPPLNKES